MNVRVVYQAASLCLSYPDDAVLGSSALIGRALTEAAPRAAASFLPLLEWWARTPPPEVRTVYVDTFDMSRRHALYLTYWTDGDTRRPSALLTIWV